MNRWTVGALRAILALALAGSVFVLVVMLPLTWIDLEGAPAEIRVPFVSLMALGIVALQVIAVCIWRLLTLVRRGTVFSHKAFRYVDVVICAIAAEAGVVFGVAVVAAYANRTTPGDQVAPGMVALICGLSLVIAGVALVVLVLRALLAQAVALDTRTRALQSELDVVI